MPIVEINLNPSNKQLRQFGVVCLFAMPLVGWLWGASGQILALLAAIGLVVAISGIVMPKSIRPLFLVLTIVATPIGMVLGELAMLLIYFAVILPIGLVFRLMNRDALKLKTDPNPATYWQVKKRPANVESYYRQS